MATPMTAAQWLDVLKREGVEYAQPYGSWVSHGRDTATGKAFGPVHGVVIHHTAGASSLSLVYNGTSSLPGPLCHGHLPKTGRVNMISRLRANHAGSFAQNAYDAMASEASVHPYPDVAEPVDANDSTYGLEIENLGNGTDPYPWDQYVAAVKWAAAICRFHGWSADSVIGHKEGTRRKIDPKGPVTGPDGNTFQFTMDTFRTHVRGALALPAGEWPLKEEEEVALSDEDIDKIARRVLTLDGVLPAARPPVANADAETNQFWTLAYGIQTAVEGVRKGQQQVGAVAAVLDEVKAKVDSLVVGGVDLDALAVKVADELYRRMAG